MVRGPKGSRSQPGILGRTRGCMVGVISAKATPPALPKEQPSPGGTRSIMVTLWPARCRKAAVEMPMMPAPMIVMWEEDMLKRPAKLRCSSVYFRPRVKPGRRPLNSHSFRLRGIPSNVRATERYGGTHGAFDDAYIGHGSRPAGQGDE